MTHEDASEAAESPSVDFCQAKGGPVGPIEIVASLSYAETDRIYSTDSQAVNHSNRAWELGMSQSARKLLQEALEGLPENATVEEAMERLLFLAKIDQGLAEADAGKTVSHEEVRKRLAL